jgi:tetratricopeptide (TPR) repeat protein
MKQLPDNKVILTNPYTSQMRAYLGRGDWTGLHQTVSAWLQVESDQPIAMFLKNIACLFINPPNIIQNKSYLVNVNKKDWKAVLEWYRGFWPESEKHNPYYQALDFILQPKSKKLFSIESALRDNPTNSELLFLQAIALRDRNASIEKLKQAIRYKVEFPAALYLLGIFSLEINRVEAAETYLKQAVEQAPDFLEAHYQLGSLYSLYIPEVSEKAEQHFQKVIELDPQGGAGIDAKKVLEQNTEPQYGQRIGKSTTTHRGGISILTILGISLLAVVLFSGPVAQFLNINNPLIGILAGIVVFIGLYSTIGRRK